MRKKHAAPKPVAVALSFAVIGLLFVFFLYVRIPMRAPHPEAVTPLVSKTSSIGPSFIHTLTIGTAQISAAFAITTAEQEQGLSDTPNLDENQGMLFMFSQPAETPFWMKDMHYALDIIWIGADKKVVDVRENLAPDTYPATFRPSVPAQYALEVNAGFAKAHSITIGTPVSF